VNNPRHRIILEACVDWGNKSINWYDCTVHSQQLWQLLVELATGNPQQAKVSAEFHSVISIALLSPSRLSERFEKERKKNRRQ